MFRSATFPSASISSAPFGVWTLAFPDPDLFFSLHPTHHFLIQVGNAMNGLRKSAQQIKSWFIKLCPTSWGKTLCFMFHQKQLLPSSKMFLMNRKVTHPSKHQCSLLCKDLCDATIVNTALITEQYVWNFLLQTHLKVFMSLPNLKYLAGYFSGSFWDCWFGGGRWLI